MALEAGTKLGPYVLFTTTALLMAQSGCASSQLKTELVSTTAIAEADGIFVRNTRLSVAPSDVDKFGDLMRRCVDAAQNAELPEQYEWLCYREAPSHYWIIVFSDTVDGFATPDDFTSFARRIGNAGGRETAQDINKRLVGLIFKTEAQNITRQYAAWSTVGSMTTATHPKARITSYSILPTATSAFDRALTARTRFLADHDYGLPIEGFVIKRGATNQARQVVFPVSWDAYHATDSVEAFVERLDQVARSEFQRLNQALTETVQNIERYDGDFVRDLSYSVQ